MVGRWCRRTSRGSRRGPAGRPRTGRAAPTARSASPPVLAQQRAEAHGGGERGERVVEGDDDADGVDGGQDHVRQAWGSTRASRRDRRRQCADQRRPCRRPECRTGGGPWSTAVRACGPGSWRTGRGRWGSPRPAAEATAENISATRGSAAQRLGGEPVAEVREALGAVAAEFGQAQSRWKATEPKRNRPSMVKRVMRPPRAASPGLVVLLVDAERRLEAPVSRRPTRTMPCAKRGAEGIANGLNQPG